MRDIDIVIVLMPGLLIMTVLFGAGVLAEHRCRRENARRQADHRAACAKAKRDGAAPPFPPNVVMCG